MYNIYKSNGKPIPVYTSKEYYKLCLKNNQKKQDMVGQDLTAADQKEAQTRSIQAP